MTRGDFLNTAVGVNRLRLNYPMLTIGCEVWKDGRVEEGALGGVWLAVGIREGAGEGGRDEWIER